MESDRSSGVRKPHDFDTTPNRAFLRGFLTTHFPDFCLCERSPILVAILGGLSPHPKIPFPAAGFGQRNPAALAAVIPVHRRAVLRDGPRNEIIDRSGIALHGGAL